MFEFRYILGLTSNKKVDEGQRHITLRVETDQKNTAQASKHTVNKKYLIFA